MAFPRLRRLSQQFFAVAAVAALAWSTATAPGASADPGCPAGTVMNIVAHQDDDLLFQSPALISVIREGLCVRTVYVTAGDANQTADYWTSRENGVRAAYAELAGVANTWTTTDAGIAGHPIPVATLDGATKISLAFMRLPDGFPDGSGGSNNGYQSLQKLYGGVLNTITTVDGSSSYTSIDASVHPAGIDEQLPAGPDRHAGLRWQLWRRRPQRPPHRGLPRTRDAATVQPPSHSHRISGIWHRPTTVQRFRTRSNHQDQRLPDIRAIRLQDLQHGRSLCHRGDGRPILPVIHRRPACHDVGELQ